MSKKHEEKEIGYYREFLNMPCKVSTNSNISYYITTYTWNEELQSKNLYNGCSIEMSISDCSKSVSLDFDIDSEEKLQNSLYKLDIIIKGCENMKKDLKIARKIIIKGQEEYEKLDKSKKNLSFKERLNELSSE